jgi:hypothetical protein
MFAQQMLARRILPFRTKPSHPPECAFRGFRKSRHILEDTKRPASRVSHLMWTTQPQAKITASCDWRFKRKLTKLKVSEEGDRTGTVRNTTNLAIQCKHYETVSHTHRQNTTHRCCLPGGKIYRHLLDSSPWSC